MQRTLASRRQLLAYGLALGAGAAMNAACRPGRAPGRNAAPSSPTAGRPARLALSWWSDTGNPSPFTFSPLGPGGVVRVSQVFDSLLWKDAHGLIPWLATSWSSNDAGDEFRFTVRPGVTWHDGQPLTAEDVAFSFSTYAGHPFSWADTSIVASATATDALTVVVRLIRPFAPFLHDVAGVLPIIPRHIWESVADPLKFGASGATVGSGPFRLEKYIEGQGQYLLRAYTGHFAGRPAFDELTYDLVPIAQQPVALTQNRIDGALAMDFDVQAQFGKGRYRVLATQPFSTVRLMFNVDRPPFDHAAFRQAIAFALDRQQIGDRVIHGDVVAGNPGIIPPESPWFAADVAQYPFDPTKAAALLDSLGYLRPGGSGLRQTPQGAPLRVQLLAAPDAADAQLVQSMLGQAGIGVDLVTADPKGRTDRQKSLDYQMALATHIGVGGDPDFLRLWYTGGGGNSFTQGNVFHDPEFAAVAEQQVREPDEARRHQLVARMQRILSEELPTITLYHRRFYWIYNPAAWDGWFNTRGGIMTGIPLLDNKLALLQQRR